MAPPSADIDLQNDTQPSTIDTVKQKLASTTLSQTDNNEVKQPETRSNPQEYTSPKIHHEVHTPRKAANGLTQSSAFPEPLAYSGTLDSYESFDVTNVIGREFPKLQLSEILSDDAKIRDLAILVSQRGVIFFRNQDINIEDQKVLGQKLGELTGKPSTSKVGSVRCWMSRSRCN